MSRLAYKLLSMLAAPAGGLLASVIFTKAWKLATRGDETPKATDASRGWPEILTAAALQGAIFAVVRAAGDRLTAEGTRSLTGTWPGEDSGGTDGEPA